MHRMLCLRWKPADIHGKRRSDAMASALLSQPGWSEIVTWRGCRLYLHSDPNDLAPIVLPKEGGVILGALFRDGQPLRSETLDIEEVGSWCAQDLENFTQNLWGPFLAVIADHGKDRVLVLRDAGAARPCFLARADDAGVSVIFTHLDDLSCVRPLGAIDCDYLKNFLALPRLMTRRTGFEDVEEVLPGECVALGRDDIRSWMAWSPPAADRALVEQPDERLASDLRRVIEQTLGAYASLQRPIIHRLSGGLDSSVALAGLVAAGADVRCVCERPLGVKEGDESAAANEVAKALNAPLLVVDYDPAGIDYRRLLDAQPAAKPSATLLTFADTNFLAALNASPDTIATSGQGGDQVFFRANATAAIGDAVRDRLALPAFVQTALDISRVTRRSVWSVFGAAFEYGVFTRPEAAVRKTLTRAVRQGVSAAAAIDEAISHPWREAARRRGPSEMMRSLFLADVGYYHTPSVLSAAFVHATVLASQPIMNACARIPPYAMMRGGRDRALVRRAFADALPSIAIDRQRKGDTTRYFAAVAARNGRFATEVLNGGELERLGLRPSADPVRMNDISPEFIAEIWLRQVASLRARASAACSSLPAA